MEIFRELWVFINEGGVAAILFVIVIYQELRLRTKEADHNETLKDLRNLSVSYASLTEGVKNAVEGLRDRIGR